jgi:septum formation protein
MVNFSAGRGSPDCTGPGFHQAGGFPACWQGASGDTIGFRSVGFAHRALAEARRMVPNAHAPRIVRAKPLMKPRLILASESPRRKQLLEEAGYEFDIEPSGINEPDISAEMSPWAYAAHLAWRKAAEVARRRSSGLILAADTICVVDGEVLTKPVDRADAERMIRLQEGRNTHVISGICLYRVDRHEWIGAVEVSLVQFKPLSDIERLAYLDSERWQDKSGGYGVQDQDPFVAVVRGSFSNVVGLPLERLEVLLQTYLAQAF